MTLAISTPASQEIDGGSKPLSFTSTRSRPETIRVNAGTKGNPIGRRISGWGYDINNLSHVTRLKAPAPSSGVGLAEELFDDEVGLGMDILRMPIFASIHKKHGYASVRSNPDNAYDHYYEAIIQAAKRAQEAKVPRDLTVFATLKELKPWRGEGLPRPRGYKDRSLPRWAVTLTEYVGERPDDNEPDHCQPVRRANDPGRETCHREQLVRPHMYVKLLRDYLTYMHRKGVHVDVLGIDNEPEENEAGIGSVRLHDRTTKKDDELIYATIVEGLKENCGVDRCPKFIGPDALGPESFDAMFPKTTAWLADVEANHRELIDYAGTHYYTKWRTPKYAAKLRRFASQAGSIELWDSEFHWTTGKTAGVIKESVHSLMSVFDHFRDFGFKAIVSWDFAVPGTSIRSMIRQEVIRSTSGTWPINAVGPDGGRMKSGKINVRAFKTTSGAVVVWILNDSSFTRRRLIRFEDSSVRQRKLVSTGTRWSSSGDVPISQTLRDRIKIPARSITYLRIPGVYES
jgi:O-glycosyl hydrolase